MREELLRYYERELGYIRRMAADFARSYPAVASRLLLEPEKCEDPHVERLIEAFALLTSRIRMQLDDGFSDTAAAFLDVLYPQYLAPFPSTTIVQLTLDPEWPREGVGLNVERGTPLHTPPVRGVRCRFRTCSPVTLWPVETANVSVIALREGELGAPKGAVAAVRILLRALGKRAIAKVGVDELSFFLDGDPAVVHRLYEVLFRSPQGLLVRDPGGAGAVFLPPEHLVPGGFGREERLLPARTGSLRGYQILQEYFVFPDKFLFARVTGLARAAARIPGDELELLVLLPRLPTDLQGKIGPENFKLGCTPAVNLFPHQADPIQRTGTVVDHPVVADAHAPELYEILSIETVTGTSSRTGATREFRPFYSPGSAGEDAERAAYWRAVRMPGDPRDPRVRLAISVIDRKERPSELEEGEVLHVRTLCTNGGLPAELPLAGTDGGLRVEGKPGVRSVRVLRKPTDVVRPRFGHEEKWRLVSHLSLNHLSIADSEPEARRGEGGGRTAPALLAFRELLSLYDTADSAVTRQRISGLLGIASRPIVRRVRTRGESLYARGVEIRLRLDEGSYAGSGVFLFASVLERFLGLYTSVNSFVQVVAETAQREGVLKTWSPRSGERVLL